jgi:hypothetical protein
MNTTIANFTKNVERAISKVCWGTAPPCFSLLLSSSDASVYNKPIRDFNRCLQKIQCKFALIYDPVADSIFLNLSKLHPVYITDAILESIPVMMKDIASIIAYYCMAGDVPCCYICTKVLWETPISTQTLEVPRLVSSDKRLACTCNNCNQQCHSHCSFEFPHEGCSSAQQVAESESVSDVEVLPYAPNSGLLEQVESCSTRNCSCASHCDYCGGPSDRCVTFCCGICNRNVCSVRALSCKNCGIACCHTETKNIDQGECSQVMYVEYCASLYNSFDDYDEDDHIWCFRCVIKLNRCKGSGCTKYVKEAGINKQESRWWNAQHSLGFHCINKHCWGCFSKLDVTYFRANMTHNWCEACQPHLYTEYRARREERTISSRITQTATR